MNNPANLQNISPDRLAAMLNLAGQKLGCSPQELQTRLQNGSLDQVTQNMSPQQQKQIGAILSDRRALAQFLESPQVKRMLDQLMKGK